jgi:hypothetical protein
MTRDLRREREIAMIEQADNPLTPRRAAERPAPPKRAQNKNADFWLRQAEADLLETTGAQLDNVVTEEESSRFEEFEARSYDPPDYGDFL